MFTVVILLAYKWLPPFAADVSINCTVITRLKSVQQCILKIYKGENAKF